MRQSRHMSVDHDSGMNTKRIAQHHVGCLPRYARQLNNSSIVCGTLPLYSSVSALAVPWIDFVLLRKKPVVRMSC